jgi:GNAT superfamily N-acetyltransferase
MSENTLTIREVVPGDFSAWSVLWDGYNRFYGREGPTALPADITALTWGRFLDPTEPMYALVAEEGGRLLGLTHFLFHRSTTLAGPTCYLQDLFTVSEARRRGIGGQLIEAVCARARQGGATRVYWQTHETNATAMRLYDRVAERTGFVIYRKLV